MSTWHVSPLGNDASDGKSWQTCFATIAKAIASASAGDKILIAPGNYSAESPLAVCDVSLHGYSWGMIDADLGHDYDSSTWRKSYTLQPNSWLARDKVIRQLLAFIIGDTISFSINRDVPEFIVAAAIMTVGCLGFRSIMELRRRHSLI